MRHRPAALGAGIFLVFLGVGLLAPYVAPRDPAAIDPSVALEGPSLAFPFGTDELGRDLFSRVLVGARISLQLGVGATIFALAMGIGKIYAVARGDELLARLKAMAPDRIETFSNRAGSSAEFVKARTSGVGADLMLDTLGAKAPLESMLDAMKGVRRGGRIVNIGGTAGDLPVDVKWWMDEQMELIGSVWFTAAEGMDIAAMVESKVVDLSVMEPMVWPLEEINEAISGVTKRDGGFTYYAVAI